MVWLTVVIAALVAIGVSAILWTRREPLCAIIRDRENLRSWVAQLDPWGSVATIALNMRSWKTESLD